MTTSETVNRLVRLQNELIDAKIERDDYRATLEEVVVVGRADWPTGAASEAAQSALERWDRVRERGLVSE